MWSFFRTKKYASLSFLIVSVGDQWLLLKTKLLMGTVGYISNALKYLFI